MKLITNSITLHPLPAEIKYFSLDAPQENITYNGHELTIAGWAYAAPPLVVRSIQVMQGNTLVKWAPLLIPRPDVAAYLGIAEGTERKYGFQTNMGALGLNSNTCLDIIINVMDPRDQSKKKIKAASVLIEHQTNLKTESKYQPLQITALGRSGTTLLMQALSTHKQILTANFYPYELRQAAYWMLALKVLNDPADFNKSSHPDTFSHNLNTIGHNPFRHPEFIQQLKNSNVFEKYYTEQLPKELARFTTKRIDEYYDMIAACENKPHALYFAEKALPTSLQAMYSNIFRAPKEIILTRDFRDIICSAQAFNSKRNQPGFGRDEALDDFDWVDKTFKHGAQDLAHAWSSRKSTTLHIRYEDLIQNPTEQMTRIFEYLDLEKDPATIDFIIKNIFTNTSSTHHTTSSSPTQSIARWKEDLPPRLLEHCNLVLKEELALFGYL